MVFYHLSTRSNESQEAGHKEGQKEGTEELQTVGRDWSLLTGRLLEAIFGQLTCLEDFFACRCVCRSWRSVAGPCSETMASQYPLLLLHYGEMPTKAYYDIHRKSPFIFRPPVDYVLGCSHGHLIAHVLGSVSTVVLINFFTGAVTRELPPIDGFRRTHRIILSSSPLSENCIVISLPMWGHFQEVRYCQLSSHPITWELGLSNLKIKDMIFYQDKLYVLNGEITETKLGVLEPFAFPWKIKAMESEHSPEDKSLRSDKSWILAASADKLVKISNCLAFILRWDFDRSGWVTESNSDGRTWFVGERGFRGSVLINDEKSPFRNSICNAEPGYNHVIVHSLKDKSFRSIHPNPFPCQYRIYNMEFPFWISPSHL